LELEGYIFWLTEMAVDLKGWWRQKRGDLGLQQRGSPVPSIFIPSPVEDRDAQKTIADLREARAKHCTDEGVKAGFKAASIACAATAIPTLTAVRMVPWVKAHLNYTGQALVISAATIATYFIVVDQTILECSRKESWDALEKRRSAAS